jgi:hypothetical protein
MTLPDERFRSVIQTKNFLGELIDPKKTPRLPKKIRDQARWCLRHYPSYWDLERASDGAPDVFQPRMEDVTRMFKQYEQSKVEKDEN